MAEAMRVRGSIWRAIQAVVRKLGRVSGILVTWVLTPVAAVLAMARIRFLQPAQMFERIGHLVLEPEFYVKSGLIGWRPRYTAILLGPRRRVVNPCLLRYWNQYIKVIQNGLLIRLLRPLACHPLLRYQVSPVPTPRGPMRLVPAIYPIQARYEALYGDRPLLTLSEADRERGWQRLRELGVPAGAWFVCLHVREAGYLPHLAHHSYRDADIVSYLPAVQAILKRGGWVIRMGDPTMKPLPRMERLIDYAHSRLRCDWMDIFCFSQGRFFLGTTSGAMNVACGFGVPCALANYAPLGHGAYTKNDLWIPKLYWSTGERRSLAFADVLRSPLARLFQTTEYEAAGISVVENTKEEILELVLEMMDRLEGRLVYSPEDERLQQRFQALLRIELEWGTTARIGRDFLHRHVDLLAEQTTVAVGSCP